MTKDIKWLKDEVYKLFPSHDEMCNYPDDITVLRTQMLHSVIDLIDQLDEPETVEQTARLLENVLKENKRLGKLLEKKHQEWFNLMDEINNQEVLSDKWIDEHITDGHNVNLGDKVVYADELDGVLVPKQEYFLDTLEDGVYAVKDGRIERGNIATEYTNKETEVLSQKWIDDNSVYASSDGITEEYVHVDDLKELLVPKQEELEVKIQELIETYKQEDGQYSNPENYWIDGFISNLEHLLEIKKYVVVDSKGSYILAKVKSEIMTMGEILEFYGHESVDIDYNLTEQEIKDYDSRYMTFAKPVEELEE